MMQKPTFFAQTPAYAVGSPWPKNDPLSDTLEAIRLHGGSIVAFAPCPPFGLAFPPGLRSLHIVESGTVSVRIDGAPETIQFARGDVLLLLHGQGHSIADQEARPLLSVEEHLGAEPHQHPATAPKGDTQWLWGTFGLDEILAHRLLSVLPPVMLMRGLHDKAFEWLEVGSRFAIEEINSPAPGSGVMISRLLDLIFIRLLRIWATGPDAAPGWLVGAMDSQVGRALAAVHANPAYPWSVPELATLVGMSRSVFAERFTRLVGQPPATYLIGLRLDRAAELLRGSRVSIAEVAPRVGYQSEAAFSRAFQSRFGVSPMRWRQAYGSAIRTSRVE